jgi:hypothetical protein
MVWIVNYAETLVLSAIIIPVIHIMQAHGMSGGGRTPPIGCERSALSHFATRA